MFGKLKDILSGKWLLDVSFTKYIGLFARHAVTSLAALIAAVNFPGFAELGELLAVNSEPLTAALTAIGLAAWGLLWSAREKATKE